VTDADLKLYGVLHIVCECKQIVDASVEVRMGCGGVHVYQTQICPNCGIKHNFYVMKAELASAASVVHSHNLVIGN
jgi:hypothetical protein